MYYWTFVRVFDSSQERESEESDHELLLAFVRELYSKKLGEAIDSWHSKKYIPLEYRHAKVKLGDVFDYYTSSDEVLKVPEWRNFKHAVDEYLENYPRVKFHPSRVGQFIEVDGIE